MSLALHRYNYPEPLRTVALSKVGPDFDWIIRAAQTYCPQLDFTSPIRGHLAGGFIRDMYLGKEPADMDIFVWHEDEIPRIQQILVQHAWRDLSRHPEIVTLVSPSCRVVQLIPTDSSDPLMTISRFDLTVCCAAADLYKKTAMCSTDFKRDIVARRLRIVNPGDIVGTSRRVERFLSQGYKLTRANALQLQSLLQLRSSVPLLHASNGILKP